MAEKKDTQVTQSPADAGGVEGGPQAPVSVKGAVHLGQPDTRGKEVAGGRRDGPTLPAEPKREADKTSAPVNNDAQSEDPPVRTTRPDVPIAVALASGAGQHQPPDPDKYTPE